MPPCEGEQSSFSGFGGFPTDAFRYFAEVAADTSWEAVERLQDLHARAVRGPMCELAAGLEAEFGRAKVYRLHRSPNLWIAQHAYLSRSANTAYGVTLDLDGLAGFGLTQNFSLAIGMACSTTRAAWVCNASSTTSRGAATRSSATRSGAAREACQRTTRACACFDTARSSQSAGSGAGRGSADQTPSRSCETDGAGSLRWSTG